MRYLKDCPKLRVLSYREGITPGKTKNPGIIEFVYSGETGFIFVNIEQNEVVSRYLFRKLKSFC